MAAGCPEATVRHHMALRSDTVFSTHYDFRRGIPPGTFSKARKLSAHCDPSLFLRRNQIFFLETFHAAAFPADMFLHEEDGQSEVDGATLEKSVRDF